MTVLGQGAHTWKPTHAPTLDQVVPYPPDEISVWFHLRSGYLETEPETEDSWPINLLKSPLGRGEGSSTRQGKEPNKDVVSAESAAG